MKNKVIRIVVIALVAAVLVAGIVVLSLLGAFGYFSYRSIKTTVSAPAVSQENSSIVIMSANIRRQEKWWSTSEMDTGDHHWYKRADAYLQNIATMKPDILGAQEVQSGQYEFLTEHLKGYGSVVTYREQGARAESCPIFYNEARFDLLDSGTYWLSKTPEKMSKDWGAKEYRITTYVTLKDKVTDLVITVFNAHPEWKVNEGRNEELKVLAQKVKDAMSASVKVGETMRAVDKVILLGDLNTYKEEANNAGMEALAPVENLLADSKDLANTYYGITFNNYGIINPEDPQAGLDYIYLPKDTAAVSVGKVDKIYDGVYPSDHFPIWAKVTF